MGPNGEPADLRVLPLRSRATMVVGPRCLWISGSQRGEVDGVVPAVLGEEVDNYGVKVSTGGGLVLDVGPVDRDAGHHRQDHEVGFGTPAELRHFYASLLIRYGESVKVVQERLGHASAAETLDTYSHLWPDSEDRTRAAVDAVLGQSPVGSDPIETVLSSG